jgi:formamidopyrimidine-DNA glycosylase
MIEPPGLKETPRLAVPPANQGKEKGAAKRLPISDKVKFRRDGKWLVIQWRPGIFVHLDMEGRQEVPEEFL